MRMLGNLFPRGTGELAGFLNLSFYGPPTVISRNRNISFLTTACFRSFQADPWPTPPSGTRSTTTLRLSHIEFAASPLEQAAVIWRRLRAAGAPHPPHCGSGRSLSHHPISRSRNSQTSEKRPPWVVIFESRSPIACHSKCWSSITKTLGGRDRSGRPGIRGYTHRALGHLDRGTSPGTQHNSGHGQH